MPLESADISVAAPAVNSFQDAMLAHLEAPAAPAPTPEPAAVAPPAPEPVAPVETLAAPAVETPAIDQIPAEEGPDFKTPLDNVELEPAAPAPEDPKKAKDPAGMRIEQLKGELNTVWKPKVTELESTVAQKEARIKELEGAAAELEQLRQFKTEAEAEMSIVRLEKTPEYQTTVGEPLARIANRAAELAETYGIDEVKLFAAIEGKTEKERRDALKDATSGLDLDRADDFEIRKLMDEAQPLFAKKDELYANADKALSELEARTEAKEREAALARADERKKATDLVSKRIGDKLPFFKTFVDEAASAVKEVDFSTLSPHDHAYNALVGAAMPKIVKEFMTKQAELDAALDELASYKKATPRVEGGLVPTQGGGERPKDLQSALLKGLGFAS